MTGPEFGVAERLAALEAHIERLDAENTQLRRELADAPRHEVGARSPHADTSAHEAQLTAASTGSTQTRRHLLKGGAIAAGAAAVAPLLSTKSAAAANGDPVTVGEVRASQNGAGTGIKVEGGLNTQPNTAGFAISDFTFEAPQSPAAIDAVGAGVHLWNGVRAFAGGRKSFGTNSGHALIARVSTSGRSHLLCEPSGTQPASDTYAHGAGEFRVSGNGTDADLWFCSKAGTPGVWRRLAGTNTSGGAHIINPTRVYDSRNPGSGGSLATGFNRVVSVANGIDVNTGAPTVSNLVPQRATAVAFNLTVFFTAGNAGFLAVQAGDATTFTASTINWFGPNQLLANGSISTLDANRQLKVFSGGQAGNATGFLIDITGYFL